jgi:hypothetical protein
LALRCGYWSFSVRDDLSLLCKLKSKVKNGKSKGVGNLVLLSSFFYSLFSTLLMQMHNAQCVEQPLKARGILLKPKELTTALFTSW